MPRTLGAKNLVNRPGYIRDQKGREISAVLIFINRLSAFTMKYQDDKDLGAFHRALAYNLATASPDETEAGFFARELLENAKIKIDERISKAEKAAGTRWVNDIDNAGENPD